MERPKIVRLDDYRPKPPPGPASGPASGRKVLLEKIEKPPQPVRLAA